MKFGLKRTTFQYYTIQISNAYERCKSKGDVINSENFWSTRLVIPIILLVLKFQLLQYDMLQLSRNTYIGQNLLGPDHVASLEPEELKAMVKAIRNIELALSGDGKKCQVTVKQKISR
jgi:hypothetical protein